MIEGAHLAGKVAIVTGSSRSIGAGIALELANRGAKVRLTWQFTRFLRNVGCADTSQVTIVYTSSRSEVGAKDLAAQIAKLDNGSKAIVVQENLRDVDAPARIVQATVDAFGDKIDILVNNAGVLFEKSVQETTADDFAAIFDVNVRAPLLMAKAVVPYLRAPGRIINISSVGARQGFELLAMYSSSKAALEGLTRGLAAELGHAGHTVNAVAPGPVKSEMLDNVAQEIVDIQLKTTPVEHRHGTV